LILPAEDRIALAAFDDQDFGFLRITLDASKHTLTGEYFTVSNEPAAPKALAALNDSFVLDLRSHTVR
jgi:hypothetical protein